MLTAEVVSTQVDSDPAAARAHAERLRTLAREALDELRSLILGLRPPELERDGLAGALRKELELLGRANGVTVELVTEPPWVGGDEVEPRRDFAILRIVHEAVQNALRHADASRIVVRLRATGVEVQDDGAGFQPRRPELRARHLGLTSMEERATELGGRLRIRSAPGQGTTVTLELGKR
jgi:signal transduction histidine kinase